MMNVHGGVLTAVGGGILKSIYIHMYNSIMYIYCVYRGFKSSGVGILKFKYIYVQRICTIYSACC